MHHCCKVCDYSGIFLVLDTFKTLSLFVSVNWTLDKYLLGAKSVCACKVCMCLYGPTFLMTSYCDPVQVSVMDNVAS